MSRGLGQLQRAVILYLDRKLHFGACQWELCLVIFGRSEASDVASMSRALRRLREQDLVECFTVPSITEETERRTEGRRLALWRQIIWRQQGRPQPRKYFKLTRKARRDFGLHGVPEGKRYTCTLPVEGGVGVLPDYFFRLYPAHRPPIKAAERAHAWRRERQR